MPIRLTLPTHYHSESHARARAFARVQSRRRHKPPAHKFDFPTELIGQTTDVTLYYDPQLGPEGATLAQQVQPNVEKTYVNCRNYFGIAGQPVNVIIAPVNGQTDGTGGAYHYGCNFNPGGDLYCDAAFGNEVMTNGMIVAELTESFMGAQNKGWDCGGSNGEALSRFLAELESGGAAGALAGFATGPTWDRAGRPNWIDASESTDQDAQVVEVLQTGDAYQRHLDEKPGVCSAPQLSTGLRQDLERGQNRVQRPPSDDVFELRHMPRRDRQEHRFSAGRQHHGVTHEVDQAGDEVGGLYSREAALLHEPKRRRRVVIRQGRQHREQALVAGDTEQGMDDFRRQPLAAGSQ